MSRFIFFILILPLSLGFGQRSQDTFGKSRVQFQKFNWKSISTTNFNIYYYQEGNQLAYNTARHLEESFDRITSTVGLTPSTRTNKINVLVYISESDLLQSNIGLSNGISAGGQTNLIKSKIQVAFKGDQKEFFKDVDSRFAELLMNIILYGGNFRDMVQSSHLISFPEWFVKGCSEFIGHGENESMFEAIEAFFEKRNTNPDKLSGEEAKLIGQSIFSYIHKQYGSYTIANMITLSKTSRNEEDGIVSSLGISYNTFLNSWKSHYKEQIDLSKSEKEYQKVKKAYKNTVITQQKASPNGDKIAYAINRKGVFRVYILDLTSNKKTLMFTGGSRTPTREKQSNIPIIAWKNNNTLSLIKFKKSKPYLVTKSVNKRLKREKKLFVTFDDILSFNYSPNEEEIVLAGVQNGQSDIYTYNVKSNVAKWVTKDLYDDKEPHYSPSGNKIIFSSNRLNDTLRKDHGSYWSLTEDYNLYEYTKEVSVLNKITNSPIKELNPQYINENTILFLASTGNKHGLFKLSLNDSEYIAKKVALPNTNIISYTIMGNQVAYKISTSGREKILLASHLTLEPDNSYRAKIIRSISILSDSGDYTQELLSKLKNINPYHIKYDSDSSAEKPSVNKNTEENPNSRVKISFPQPLEPRFAIDYIISTVEVDPIRNLGLLTEVGTSDMMGNHRFSGRLYTSANFRSYDLTIKYDYLEQNLDWGAEVNQDSYFRISQENLSLHRQTKTEFTGHVSKPVSQAARFKLSSGFNRTKFVDHFSLNGVSNYNLYNRTNLSFVYDNTIEKSLNQFQGFKLKTQFEILGKINGNIPGYNKFTVDARNYLPIFRDMVFATRVSYGRFGGAFPRTFIMGGLDNWLFLNYEDNDQFDPLEISSNGENEYLLFSEFSTNLRGFGYNKINGNSHLLFNAELRIPIVKMFYTGIVSSPFFRNLQLNTFYDAGSAWNGSNPFSQDNSVNTREEELSPPTFRATVTNYQNPFISSFGFGLRSMIFSYYMKFDVAWPVENFTVQDPMLQLSLGYDF